MIYSFTTDKKFLDCYLQALELSDLTFSYFPYGDEEAESANTWKIDIYDHHFLDILKIIESIRKQFNLPDTKISISDIESKDWVTEVQKNFKPIIVNNIYIYSSYYKHTVPKYKNSSICINIDPGNAFGTGEHHTTKGCLRALSNLSKTHLFNNIIDIGCGSAILAIAAAKLFKESRILATDIDHDAVTVSQENIIKNNVENIVKTGYSNGIHGESIQKSVPFDLIICNILANVLIEISNDINKICTKNSIIILSGLTIRQLEAVTKKYSQHGFEKLHVIYEDEWCSIIMQKY